MKLKKVLIGLLIVLVAAAAAGAIVWKCSAYDDIGTLTADASVKITGTDDTQFFDGKGTEDVLIFYPGAMVEHTAYSALMQELAAQGIDCYLLRMPLRLALLNTDAADPIIRNGGYEHVYIGGHSLGGVVACMYADQHPEALEGIILLASYSSKDLSDTSLRILSITGSVDGVISTEKQASARALLPQDAEFVTIEGGNHAGFGTYGAQKGDGTAAISPEQQREETCTAIAGFVSAE